MRPYQYFERQNSIEHRGNYSRERGRIRSKERSFFFQEITIIIEEMIEA